MAQNVEIGDLLANRSGGTHGGAGRSMPLPVTMRWRSSAGFAGSYPSRPIMSVAMMVMLAPVSSTTGITSDGRPSAASRRRSTTMDETAGSKTTRDIRK